MKTNNELIAEFHDGTSFDENGLCTDPNKKYSWRPGCYDALRVNHLRYHESWDWLMPVVEKIESLGFRTLIKSDSKTKQYASIFEKQTLVGYGYGSSKIIALHTAVVDFIKWNKKALA